MKIQRAWITAVALAAIVRATGAVADATPAAAPPTPAPPPEGVWIGKGQFGFLKSSGNTSAESINGSIDLSRYDGPWKNAAFLGGLYGKNSGIASAQRWETREQTNYTITHRMFAFGGLRYERDLFDGFQYQASLTGGLGYKMIDSGSTQLTAQIGAGYRRLRPEVIIKDANGEVLSRTLEDATGEAIGTIGVDYVHKFNASTSLSNKFLMEAGSSDTLLHDELALAVKMSEKLALSVGYSISDNTHPPGTLKKVDTTTTVNLVFAF